MRWLSLLLLLPLAAAPAETTSERIGAILESSPSTQRAFWGVEVLDLTSGDLLYSLNAHRLFVPASNAKLFTTALGLERLGPEYRFRTTVVADAPPDGAGRIAGSVRLVGGGDPMLSARPVPYQKGSWTGDPLQAIEALADQVVARGVRRIDGDIIGDDTAYVWAPYPEGWAVDDAVWEYGAPVSALTINDNMVLVTVRSRPKPGPAELVLSPALEFYSIDNRVRVIPGAEAKVNLERLPGLRQLRLWGTLPADPPTGTRLPLAIDDPALYAATAFAGALERRGVEVRGHPIARHRFANEAAETAPRPQGVELARRESPPLSELLRIIDKVSQNLHAELVLREVARTCRGAGTREAGLEESRAFLKQADIDEGEITFEDGSGLSRMDLVTPDAVVRLLRMMYASRHRDEWVGMLPQGGVDGTLETRFNGNPLGRRIHAKTGSLSHVAALSGYIESASRGPLAFSILVNNFSSPAADIQAAIDRIALLLAE